MMPRRLWLPLVVSAAITIALLAGAAWNRGGVPDAVLTLTERELTLPSDSALRPPDDTGLALRIVWQQQDDYRLADGIFNEAKMRELGFECRMPTKAARTEEEDRHSCDGAAHRLAYVVFEYDGPAWQRLVEQTAQRATTDVARTELETLKAAGSRLMIVDAAPRAEPLRARYPDRARYLILAAEIEAVGSWWHAMVDDAAKREAATAALTQIEPFRTLLRERRLIGRLTSVTPDRLNVTLAQRTGLDRVPARGYDPERKAAQMVPRYEVRIAVGRRLEPWIEEVRPLQ